MDKKTQYAFVRQLQKGAGANLKTFADIKSAERHAKRLDNTSALRQRDGADHADNYFWSNLGQGLEDGGADYTDAYKAHKAEHGVKSERKGAALAAHALVGVSPEWLAETGSPHDLTNPRVEALIKAAKDWVESWAGKDMVWAVRYDVDEVGSGVVDILASPVRSQFHKSGSSNPKISINKANGDLVDQVNVRLKKEWVDSGHDSDAYKPIMKSFRAMQDSWAWYAQEHLSPKLERGDYIERTRREHIFPEEYKDMLAAKDGYDEFENKAREEAEALARWRLDLQNQQNALDAQKKKQNQERKDLDNAQKSHQATLDELARNKAELTRLKALLERAKKDLAHAHEQVEQILADARSKADGLIKVATEHVRVVIDDAMKTWPEFATLTKPFVEMRTLYQSLLSAVSDLFDKLNLGNDPKYVEQLEPEELGPDGEVPLVDELLKKRAKSHSEQIAQVMNPIRFDGP